MEIFRALFTDLEQKVGFYEQITLINQYKITR